MRQLSCLLGVALTLASVSMQTARALPHFTTVIQLDTTSDPSANVSLGDLDGDGDLDIVLAKLL